MLVTYAPRRSWDVPTACSRITAAFKMGNAESVPHFDGSGYSSTPYAPPFVSFC